MEDRRHKSGGGGDGGGLRRIRDWNDEGGEWRKEDTG